MKSVVPSERLSGASLFSRAEKYFLVLFLLLWVLFPMCKGAFLKAFLLRGVLGLCSEGLLELKLCCSVFSRNMQHGSSHGN